MDPVNDRLGHVEVTTNGTRTVTDTEPPEPMDGGAPRSFDGQSVDKRLDALMETIRTWDWRAASVEARTPPADVTASPVPAPAAPSNEVRESPEPLTLEPPMVRATDTQPVLVEPMLLPPRLIRSRLRTRNPLDDAGVPDLGPEHRIARLWSHPRTSWRFWAWPPLWPSSSSLAGSDS